MVEDSSPSLEKDPRIQFAQRLDTILFKKVSVENIGTFADEALEELVTLNESVVAKYQAEYLESDAYVGVELENHAYAAYGLEDLNAILTRITDVQENIGRITLNVSESLNEIDTVITPPDPSGPAFTGNGSGTYEKPEMLDRLVTLAYILERDFDLDNDDVRHTKGITTGNMVRSEPYVRVEIDSLNRIVYVCDEEGNASYVFDIEVLEHLGITPPELDVMSKNQRNALLLVQPETGTRIIQSPQWREVMSNALSNTFSGELMSEVARVEISEFSEKVKPLPYGDFQEEVRAAYKEAGSPSAVYVWYRNEYKQRRGWPANPGRTYLNNGFGGYVEMVGNEVTKLLPYEEFLNEVQEAYMEARRPSGVTDWYKNEYKAHRGWPANPNQTYRDDGFGGYPEMVGNEVAEFLPYEEFLAEVRTAYKESGSPNGVTGWYTNEYKQRRGWPASPNKTHKDAGFSSYPEMVGNEVVEFLPYEEFLNEVRTAYKEAGRPSDILRWYQNEYKQHKGWPSAPHDKYKGESFSTYAKMVGNEVVEFLPYEEFLNEVRTAYKESGSPNGVKGWYTSESKQQRGWPSEPFKIYKDYALNRYPEMVGNKIVEFLLYENFLTEVQIAYREAGQPRGIKTWYENEYKRHKGWPSSPRTKYKNNGFTDYAEMVSNEKPRLLSYEDFLAEVRTAYKEAGSPNDVSFWYKSEYKQRNGWPSNPNMFYEKDGYEGYPQMVGKK